MKNAELYCPKCGENTPIEICFIAPGEEELFICDTCGSVWKVSIRFDEVTKENES